MARDIQTTAPLITVVIPVYNRLQYLHEAICSVLEQTYANTEIIIVDDGSEVEVALVLDAFGKRVNLLRKQNGGLASARNYGIALARGEFILFLDDDDFLEPTALQRLHEVLSHDSGAVWAAGRFAYVDEKRQRLPKEHRCQYMSGDIYSRMIFDNLMGAPCTVLARTDIIRKMGGFDESVRILNLSEDYDLWLSLSRDFPIVAIQDIVANYRLHAAQVSRRQWSRHYEAHIAVLQKQRLRARSGFEATFQQGIARIHLAYGDDLYVGGQHVLARKQWSEASQADCGVCRHDIHWRYVKSYIPYALLRFVRLAASRYRSRWHI